MRRRLAVAVLVLAAAPAAAQGRGPQIVTGVSLASLGVYAAVADRDCDIHPRTTHQNGRCEWRNSTGRLVGEQPELPAEQLAGGLAVAWIGGLTAVLVTRDLRFGDTPRDQGNRRVRGTGESSRLGWPGRS